MSAYEQHVETPDDNFQYILFAAEPYETLGFKIPNKKIDKSEGKFFTHWFVTTRNMKKQYDLIFLLL